MERGNVEVLIWLAQPTYTIPLSWMGFGVTKGLTPVVAFCRH
jgi:hypothetical protein